MIKIGILDKETQYVTRLSAYLNRYGKGMWSVSAFTETDSLAKYMSDKFIDVLVLTNKEALLKIKDQYGDRCYIWLADEREHRSVGPSEQRIYMVYRYQSAKHIGETLKDIVEYLGMLTQASKKNVVIYSPVGRCGKTTLATSFVTETLGEKWLYVGMEDYGGSSMYREAGESNRRNEKDVREVMYMDILGDGDAENFVYYLKERDERAMLAIMSKCGGMIPSAFSLFDTRLVSREDIKWFFEVFEKALEYKGVIFDMGTGILSDINVLSEFKYIIVPYINDSISMAKRMQFEEIIQAYELSEMMDRVKYIDMSGGMPVEELKRLLA